MNEQTNDNNYRPRTQYWGLYSDGTPNSQTAPLTINDVMGMLFRSENIGLIQGDFERVIDLKNPKPPEPKTFLSVRGDLITAVQALTACTYITSITQAFGVHCEHTVVKSENYSVVHFMLHKKPAQQLSQGI